MKDCDDTDAEVSPNAAEVVGNGVDDDCDRNDSVARRVDVRSFAQPQWAWSGAVSWDGDRVTVGGQSGGTVTRPVNRYTPFGIVRAIVGVRALSGPHQCQLKVESTQPGTAPLVASVTLGVVGNVLSAPLAVHDAPRSLSKLTLTCPAGSSAEVDWVSLANAPSAAGPLLDVASASWVDIEAPVGGLSTSVVRVPMNVSGGSGVSDGAWLASDIGGVAHLDGSMGAWTTANGSGLTGLTSQGALAVWDVLPSTWDGSVYALTGRYTSDTQLAGGLWVSPDEGVSWTELANSDDDDVFGRGRYGFCNDKPYSGGALLAEEEDSTTVYIANGDPDATGVWLYDGTSVCELPDMAGALPTDGHVRALLRVRTPGDDREGLVVGLAARGATDPSLYMCTLPENDTATSLVVSGEKIEVSSVLDYRGDVVNIACAGFMARCEALSGSEGLDVRDLERDPLDASLFYLGASGLDDTCAYADEGWIDVWAVSDAPSCSGLPTPMPYGGCVGAELVTSLAMPTTFDPSRNQTLTGITWDLDGEYLFAFFPLSHDSPYDEPRAFRIHQADLSATDPTGWEPLSDTDDAARIAMMNSNEAWIGWEPEGVAAATWPASVKPDPYAGNWAPGGGIDGTFIEVWPYGQVGLFTTEFNVWAVLDAETTDPWDADGTTQWSFAPWPDLTNNLTFQTTVVNDVAMDGSGRIWAAVNDLGVMVQESEAHHAALDCVWDNYNGGGKVISIGTDDSVWVGIYDQSGGDPYHEVGVFKTTDGGTTWGYQGAAYDDWLWHPTRTERTVGGTIYSDAICKDADVAHQFAPLGGTGRAFADDEFLLDESPTWGNLVDLEAVDEHVAFALFSTGTGGRLSYTVDGGGTWTAVTYDGSWTDTDTTPHTDHTCTEATFFGKVKGMALVLPGSTTVGVDTNSDAIPDTVDATLYLASRYNTGYSATSAADRCGLAKVTLDNGVATWSWVALQRSFTQADCQVDEGNILGVSSPLWTPSSATEAVAYIWGGYSYIPTPATHYGGACTIAADGTDTQLVNPATYSMSIGEVTPAPADTDWLFVAGYTDITAQLEQWKYGAGLGFDPAYPLLIDTSASGGTLELTTTPPSLMGLAAGWGADVTTGDPQLLYATEGSGAWRGRLTW